MPRTKKSPPDPKAQNHAFRKLARELECDESEEAFDAVLRDIGSANPDNLATKKAKPKKN
jgi:hypothetical protein